MRRITGVKFRAAKTWLGIAQQYRLYIDGDWRDTNVGMFSSHSPALSVRVTPANVQPFLVEVYVKARATVKAKICVDGKQIGGDTF